MAFDAFLKIPTIPGESTDEKHIDWINILFFSHGVSQPAGGTLGNGGARPAQRAGHQEFAVVKALDKASPKLAVACCSGERISNIVLELCQAGGNKTKYMEYKMTDVTIASVCPKGATQGKETVPLEEVTFSYHKIEWAYTVVDHMTGMPKGEVKAYWDLVTDTGG
jgi:type VI secretion system secreted protein Hcp